MRGGSDWGTAIARRVAAIALLLVANVAMSAPPDFSGTWERYPDPFGDGPIPDDPPPPDGGPTLKEPYATRYRKLIQNKVEANKRGVAPAEPSSQCFPEGMPTIMGAVHPIEILQTPKQLIVLAEFLTQTRRVYLNENLPPLEDVSPGYNGYAVGRWEGQTLVVETIGVRDNVEFMHIPHSAQMKITERIRLTSPDELQNQITIEDPSVLARPYKFTFGYRRNPDYRLMEYICDNNRYAVDDQGNSQLNTSTK